VGLVALALCPALARADGGTVRVSKRQGPYEITVFTSPTPLRAGPVDVSVFVQDSATGEVVPEVRVLVRATPRNRESEVVSRAATAEAATNKLFRAAVFDLLEPGWWDVEVLVEGNQKTVQVRFDLEAAPPSPRWVSLWPWVTWPVLVIALFCVHRLRVAAADAAVREHGLRVDRTAARKGK
jgi:hypothetical protein